jgi:hypothetical protein
MTRAATDLEEAASTLYELAEHTLDACIASLGVALVVRGGNTFVVDLHV